MHWQAWFTLCVVVLVFAGMVRNWGSPDILFLAGTLAVTLLRIITPEDAFRGFSNEGTLTVAGLFVIAASLRETGALDAFGGQMLGKSGSPRQALGRMAVFLTTLGAFIQGTPIVAMMLSVVTDWCRKNRVSPSRLLIPLSYFTILGGMCTLVGTSTNVVVSGMMTQVGLPAVSLFELTRLGVPCALLGIGYLLLLGARRLPDRKDLLEQLGETSREYLVDMQVQPGCRLSGQTVEQAGLRHLPGLFLASIARHDQWLSPVSPDEVLQDGDRLTFTGVVGSIVDLERIPGLIPAVETNGGDAHTPRHGRRLCEAVISVVSPLVGKTIREADFRALYNAVIIAVHRGGVRLQGRVGDIRLRPGDTLLLETGAHFARAHRNDPDFVLVSHLDEARPVRHDRTILSLALVVGLIVLMTVAGKVFSLGGNHLRMPDVVVAVSLVAVLMIGTRCISAPDARGSVDWQTLIIIAAAYGLGKALEKSGAARAIAELVVHSAGMLGPTAVLGAIYLVTMAFAEVITHYAAVVLMFPLAMAVAHQLGVAPRPFAVAIMFGASFAFATPTGYLRNMMVYGPGGYRFSDFVRVGLPLNLLLWITCTLAIPWFWPFH